MADRIDVMISSTARDLPEHRQHALDACLRMGMFPIMMEHLPANDDEAISISLKMVDEAEIYVGVFAWRYGYVPKGHDISVTEMEYNRAKERGIPRLIYIMHEDHPTTGGAIEKGEGAVKLEAFKTRVKGENIINEFKSPEDLRGLIIHGLSKHRTPNLSNLYETRSGDIPAAPEPYIAHPYTLLQTAQVIGRQAELNLLTDWVTKPVSDVYKARILNIVAMGGMGKSALTWKWFNEIAPLEMQPLKGRLWWSFYESDARFENFLPRALAYVSGMSREDAEKLPPGEQETRLLNILEREPYLLVLDGLERILMAYARMDAIYLADDNLDEETFNRVTDFRELPHIDTGSFLKQHRLRRTNDLRAGIFLSKLAQVKTARILISTRLYPADLQTVTGTAMPGSFAYFIPGLRDDDALELWRAMGVSGSRDTLLPMFNRFENYPLLIRALAGMVANDRRFPGDFDAWQAANPQFDPFRDLSLIQVKSHVLEYALRGLNRYDKKVLQTISMVRMPATYDTLYGVHVGIGNTFSSDTRLDKSLSDLEDRGLLGWDKLSNRYDLHPVVRGVVWNTISPAARKRLYSDLRYHFHRADTRKFDEIQNFEDLGPTIELYNAIIGLQQYDEAWVLLNDRLQNPMLYRLGCSNELASLLEMLFPDGLDELPRLTNTFNQVYALNLLCAAYHYRGQPSRAIPLSNRRDVMLKKLIHQDNRQGSFARRELATGLRNLSETFRMIGRLYDATTVAHESTMISRAIGDSFKLAISYQCLGMVLGSCGHKSAESTLQAAITLFNNSLMSQKNGVATAYYAQVKMWSGDLKRAMQAADRAWKRASESKVERDLARASRLQGTIILMISNDLEAAYKELHFALIKARSMHLAEEEIPTLVALAELSRRVSDLANAREILNDLWEAVDRGPYPLFHADALNVLAQIERDAGNRDKAIEAATKAYELAWCDGISADGKTCYAYWWGLKKAREHLDALEARWPDLPPFDASKFEPMPEVEINPRDEFYGEEVDSE